MSAGISALGWAAIVGATAVTANSADTARKSAHAQMDALNRQQTDDARAAAEAITTAQVNANALRVAQKRAYQSNALALGSGDTNMLASGATGPQRASAVAPTVSALGAGAPVTSVSRNAGGM